METNKLLFIIIIIIIIIVLKKYRYTVFKENCFYLKLFLIFSFKIDSITMDPVPDLDPDPDPN